MALLGFKDDRQLIMVALTVVALAGGYLFYDNIYAGQRAQLTRVRQETDSLEVLLDGAKRELASGTVEDLRRRVEQYTASVELMRRLVPQSNEVPTLIDDITTKAKVRGVTVGKIQPLTRDVGRPFDTYRYQIEVYGHYDQIGEYLADIASLPRIVVPQDVILSSASQQVGKLLQDTVGALLLAQFSIRTYVKAAAPRAPPAGARPGARR